MKDTEESQDSGIEPGIFIAIFLFLKMFVSGKSATSTVGPSLDPPNFMPSRFRGTGFGWSSFNAIFEYSAAQSTVDTVRYNRQDDPDVYILYNISGSWPDHTWRMLDDAIKYYSRSITDQPDAVGWITTGGGTDPAGVIIHEGHPSY